MSENSSQNDNLRTNCTVNLNQYYKLRTRDKKFSLDMNMMSSSSSKMNAYTREGVIMKRGNQFILEFQFNQDLNCKMQYQIKQKDDKFRRKLQCDTIQELEEHKISKEIEDQSQYFVNADVFNQPNNQDNLISDSMKNSRLRMINSKKQSAEFRTNGEDVFLDKKSHSGASKISGDSNIKIRRPQKSGVRVSRSLDDQLARSKNYINLLTSGCLQSNNSYNRNELQKQIQNKNSYNMFGDKEFNDSNFVHRIRKSSSSADDIIGRKRSQYLIDQLENIPQRRWALFKESTSLLQLTINCKFTQMRPQHSSGLTRVMPVVEMMSEYYSKQYLHCIKNTSINKKDELIINSSSQQLLPQFFTEESAAKYILKLYKNRNILKKSYIEEIQRSKEGQIQFKECCLDGKCNMNGNKNPHVNKIKCMNQYLLLYRAFQDEVFFNELVINTYDFLTTNHELFTQMVCFFFFNENVSFNRQFKCLEFCLKWIRKRPFTFTENLDLFNKMKQFVSFLKLKYHSELQQNTSGQQLNSQGLQNCNSGLSQTNGDHKQNILPCKCESYLGYNNDINSKSSLGNSITYSINSPLKFQIQSSKESQSNTADQDRYQNRNDWQRKKDQQLSSNNYKSQNSYENQNNQNSYSNQNTFNMNNSINNNIMSNSGMSSMAYNSLSNNITNNDNYDSTHISLEHRSEKRRGPPPALARYNNIPNSSPQKKLLCQIVLNQNKSSSTNTKKQSPQKNEQIQTIDTKTTSLPYIKETRGATSIYAGSQAATAYTFPLQGDAALYSQTESSANINTYKSLFSERKESNESVMISSFKSQNIQHLNTKSMMNALNNILEDINISLPNKDTYPSTTNLITSMSENYSQNINTNITNNNNNNNNNNINNNNNKIFQQSLMSKSQQLPSRQLQQQTTQNDRGKLTHKDSILEEDVLDSQESSYISSSGTSSRDKSQSLSALASTVQSLQVTLTHQKPQNQKRRLSQQPCLTISELQLREFSQKVRQIEQALNSRIVSTNDQMMYFQYPYLFSCLSQEQIEQMQQKWEVAMQSRHYERINTQMLKDKYSKDIFNQFDIETIAQQICLIDHALYSNIHIYEFFSDKRLKLFNLFTAHSQRTNLNIVKKRFNQFTYFLIFLFLLMETKEEILNLYERLLELSEKSLEYQNYSLCLQIYTSFNSSIVYDIIKIAQKSQSQTAQKRFIVLEKAIEFNRSFNALKESMHKAKPPLVPALNIITRDLTLLDQHRDDFMQIQHQPQLDLVKYEEISKLTQVIFTVKLHNYPFIIYPAVYDFFSKSYEKFMAQYIEMKDPSKIEFKLSEFAKKQAQNKQQQ